ncbi:T6SS effector amidase Tae4 family protein [Massilia sp. GCM10020059]|uniref:Type VI secretion system amidase effector protein Tae4 n=1 Tax=Massilia agrisoli TaxID=2892444 RepID=A0ABS8IUK3_9BURK|nr:type VI secretion system amidase effector protein Tae4 [Massilia agrisoli]
MKPIAVSGGHRPTYAALEVAYPSKSMPRAQLYEELGIGELTNKAEYENTCAIRLSYAVTKAGLALRKGGLRINKGVHKGKRIEPSMRKLAEHLAEMWGPPERYASEEAARSGIGRRKGVAAFFFGEILPLAGAQGHIDIIKASANGYFQCAGACFFGPKNKIWFWPLR